MCSEPGPENGLRTQGGKNSPWRSCEDLGSETSAKLSLLGGLCGIVCAEVIEKQHLGRLHGILINLL